MYSLIYDQFHRLTRTVTCQNLKAKLLENILQLKFGDYFKQNHNFLETVFIRHISSVISIDSFKNKANQLYGTMIVMVGLN